MNTTLKKYFQTLHCSTGFLFRILFIFEGKQNEMEKRQERRPMRNDNSLSEGMTLRSSTVVSFPKKRQMDNDADSRSSKSTKSENCGEICFICYEAYQQNQGLKHCCRLKCQHSFCRSCLEKWYMKKKSCPICRHAIAYEDVKVYGIETNMDDENSETFDSDTDDESSDNSDYEARLNLEIQEQEENERCLLLRIRTIRNRLYNQQQLILQHLQQTGISEQNNINHQVNEQPTTILTQRLLSMRNHPYFSNSIHDVPEDRRNAQVDSLVSHARTNEISAPPDFTMIREGWESFQQSCLSVLSELENLIFEE